MRAERELIDAKLKEQGVHSCRHEGDRITEIDYRRLRAFLQLTEDLDCAFLDELAAEGVRLGVDIALKQGSPKSSSERQSGLCRTSRRSSRASPVKTTNQRKRTWQTSSVR